MHPMGTHNDHLGFKLLGSISNGMKDTPFNHTGMGLNPKLFSKFLCLCFQLTLLAHDILRVLNNMKKENIPVHRFGNIYCVLKSIFSHL